VEDCFYIAIEAARIARKYSTPVFILSDTSLATRIEAFDEPDLSKLMVDPKPDLSPRRRFKPYPVDQITQHVRPARDSRREISAAVRTRARRNGSPDRQPELHMVMTAKRRNKLRKLAEEIPVPEIYGDQEGDTLLVGWGSTYGPIHDAVNWRAITAKKSARFICATSIRCRTARKNLREVQTHRHRRDERPGRLRLRPARHILRARYCEPKIESFTKTDGLTFRVKEILDGVFKGRSFAARNIPRAGAEQIAIAVNVVDAATLGQNLWSRVHGAGKAACSRE
jgi:2-oxoglutarate ferredoxin oxidoreductase subunit alpha